MAPPQACTGYLENAKEAGDVTLTPLQWAELGLSVVALVTAQPEFEIPAVVSLTAGGAATALGVAQTVSDCRQSGANFSAVSCGLDVVTDVAGAGAELGTAQAWHLAQEADDATTEMHASWSSVESELTAAGLHDYSAAQDALVESGVAYGSEAEAYEKLSTAWYSWGGALGATAVVATVGGS